MVAIAYQTRQFGDGRDMGRITWTALREREAPKVNRLVWARWDKEARRFVAPAGARG